MLQPKLIDLNDWIEFGGGGNGVSYYHKTDDTVMMKLNAERHPAATAENDYSRSKTAYQMGIRCPKVIDYVTDGRRVGIICERIKDKKSFSKMLAENPDRIDELARDMASAAKALHSTPCDTIHFDNVSERYRGMANRCPSIPHDILETINSYADEMRPTSTCLHSDLQIGNLIRSNGQDYWIDLGDFGYGDPDQDFSSFYIMANLTPKHVVKWLTHISRRQFRKFVNLYGHYYYGEQYDTQELQEKLKHVALLKLSRDISENPRVLSLYKDLYRGNDKAFAVKMWFMDRLVWRLKAR